MSRIRTVKPELFKHEELYLAEQEEGLPLRVAFIGMFTVVDREGRFKWRPKQLKLDVLPYDDVDFSRVLHALTTRGFLVKYTSNGEDFGYIPTFSRHQVINNRESASTLPNPLTTKEDLTRAPRVKDACPTPLRLVQGEGKGREGKEGNESYTKLPTTNVLNPREEKVGGGLLFDQFCLAMNATPPELLKAGQGWMTFKADFDKWVAAGAVPELDVWPTITAVVAKYRDQNAGKLPANARYFTPAISRAIEVRKATMPETSGSSVIVGPNGKVLAPNGKPWKFAPPGSVWHQEFKFWLTPAQVEYRIEDATKHKYLDVAITDLEGHPYPWLPEDTRNRVQEVCQGDSWHGVYLNGHQVSTWPVRAPESLWELLKETACSQYSKSNYIPFGWKAA